MQEIEAWFKAGCGAGSARLEAVPGAGKTHLLVMLSRSMGPRDAIVAFSKDIKNELERRVKPGTPVTTVHALGLRWLKEQSRSLLGKDVKVEANKLNRLARAQGEDARGARELASQAEMCLLKLKPPQDKAVHDLLQAAWKDFRESGTLTFCEMLSYPARLAKAPSFERLLVDEAQDLSMAALKLVKTLSREQLYCGDRYQSIFDFAGAEAGSMERIERECAVHFEAPITRRCPREVVSLAQRYNSKLIAADNAPHGEVQHLSPEDAVSGAGPGSLMLARSSKELLKVATTLHALGRRCTLRGDALERLIALARRLPDLERDPLGALERAFDNAEDPEALEGDLMALARLIESGLSSHSLLSGFATALGESHPDSVILSSMHRAKGLEAPEVTLLSLESDLPAGLEAAQQERNLRYVALTRVNAHGSDPIGGRLRLAGNREQAASWLHA